MFRCSQCHQQTLKFKKNDIALFVNIIPDAQNRPNYKTQYTIVKVLGIKCFPAFSFNSKGESKKKKLQEHDYVCQAINNKNTFPAHGKQLYPLTEGNEILKNMLSLS